MTPNGALHGADKPIKRVAIIGGGPAGVVQAQQLLQVSEQQDCRYRFEPTIFERRANLGPGIWACDRDAGPCNILFDAGGRAYARWDEKARRWPPGAMYEGLRTNLPVDLMTYRDTPFQEDARAPFPARKEVEDYLRAFSEQVLAEGTRSGRCDVRLNTAVQNVVRTSASSEVGRSVWSVESCDLDSGHSATDLFDFIVLANGRCNVPSLPPIDGLWNFKGRRILHSAWYRTPWEFGDDRRVVVVGNMSSGMDIARELSGWVVRTNDDFEKRDEWVEKVKGGRGPQVINSIEDMTKPPAMDYDPLDPHSPDWSRSIRVVPRIARIEEDGAIVLEDGQTLEDIDAIVFATGFYAQYEFIDHSQEPFASQPLVLRPRPVLEPSRGQPPALQSWIQEKQGGEPFSLRQPAASGPSNLDDWYLFYEPDRSLAILGLPTATVPFPMTHVQSHFVASYWGGMASTLPALDRELMQNDPTRWKAVIRPEEAKSRGPNTGPMPLIFGSESEPFYIGEYKHKSVLRLLLLTHAIVLAVRLHQMLCFRTYQEQAVSHPGSKPYSKWPSLWL